MKKQPSRKRPQCTFTWDADVLNRALEIAENSSIPISRLANRALELMIQDGEAEAIRRMTRRAK